MTLAIITITRNDLAGLRRTLASVEAQTTPPAEHWIIDGASTDGTREFLAALPPHPARHVVSEPDNGIYDAMNKGVARASADYVWFLNSGDACADSTIVSPPCGPGQDSMCSTAKFSAKTTTACAPPAAPPPPEIFACRCRFATRPSSTVAPRFSPGPTRQTTA